MRRSRLSDQRRQSPRREREPLERTEIERRAEAQRRATWEPPEPLQCSALLYAHTEVNHGPRGTSPFLRPPRRITESTSTHAPYTHPPTHTPPTRTAPPGPSREPANAAAHDGAVGALAAADCAVGSGEWAEPPHPPRTLRRRPVWRTPKRGPARQPTGTVWRCRGSCPGDRQWPSRSRGHPEAYPLRSGPSTCACSAARTTSQAGLPSAQPRPVGCVASAQPAGTRSRERSGARSTRAALHRTTRRQLPLGGAHTVMPELRDRVPVGPTGTSGLAVSPAPTVPETRAGGGEDPPPSVVSGPCVVADGASPSGDTHVSRGEYGARATVPRRIVRCRPAGTAGHTEPSVDGHTTRATSDTTPPCARDSPGGGTGASNNRHGAKSPERGLTRLAPPEPPPGGPRAPTAREGPGGPPGGVPRGGRKVHIFEGI